MKIASADVALNARHTASRHDEQSETLRSWVGTRRPDFEGRRRDERALAATANEASVQARISDSARQLLGRLAVPESLAATASEAEQIESAFDAAESDPVLNLIRSMVEMITGRAVRTFSAAQLAGDGGTAAAQPPAPPQRHRDDPAAAPAATPAGFGIEYDYRSVHEESEQTDVAAQGTIKTADGREIAFTLALSMSRQYREESSISVRVGDAVRKDPLVINFAGNAAQLTNQRFDFDLDADGTRESVAMLAGGSGYLALDLNMNGRIDDGRELFGPASGQGFADLARLDEDGNGWIDENDSAFQRLRIWQPDQQGNGNLAGLAQSGVGALYLGHTASPFELRGSGNEDLGAVRDSGIYVGEDGTVGSLQEIDLSV